jgi:anti-sigma B factor antagonist
MVWVVASEIGATRTSPAVSVCSCVHDDALQAGWLISKITLHGLHRTGKGAMLDARPTRPVAFAVQALRSNTADLATGTGSAMSAFSVTEQRLGTQSVLSLTGEFDIAGAGEVVRHAQTLLGDGDVTDLVLDLAKVTFIDSTGIGALVAVRNLAVERSVSVHLREPQPAVAALLGLTAVDRLFARSGDDSGPVE